ncbi:MAG UNVERIFIED_CONTAM: hypothetical protein LVQ98_03050 [Rickettsiaceae bacterium]|jgi:dihydrofolate synthase/folylpolyglutamate synthase
MVFMPHWPIPSIVPPKRVNLEPMRKLLDLLGNPHKKTPPVIHIAGTNGKGSSVAYLKAIFEAANYKAHTYTSPHLLEFNERIVIAGEKIFDDYLFQLIERVRLVSEKYGLENTFFELYNSSSFYGICRKFS